ncbi:MAG TPA: glycoside hydrolase, partial [Deltaproteobacteria bacterium]|nr:glycoside hydrolase [Deltaproteobacteria bacterium]
MPRFLCIHGHFYQPPRENPWTGEVEEEKSARPYHDWNARITAECYEPNLGARILDSAGHVVERLDNYSRMSFNFGPTLLAWMEKKAPQVYRGILDSDRESQKKFSGHGSALAQAYNHVILPLATRRDKETQVIWGRKDFEHRFGRAPEGMWLPETAVDLETLEILAEQGLRFTILAPRQARRVRKFEEEIWREVGVSGIETLRPYRVFLHSGKMLDLFFYDGLVSQAVAFERLLSDGTIFLNRLAGRFSGNSTRAELVHIATDGETYGHHHKFGEMALAYVLNHAEERGLTLSNYGEYLEKFPPTAEVEIVENSSWSCAHGVARWKSDCGCNVGGVPEWNQAWRAPLREALEELRDGWAVFFEQAGADYFDDPWAARNDFIALILDPSPEQREVFLSHHRRRELSPEAQNRALLLLDLQHQSQLMFTSCGWFFDE